MDSNNIILPLILIGLGLLFYKFFFPILNKNYPRLLIDDQFIPFKEGFARINTIAKITTNTFTISIANGISWSSTLLSVCSALNFNLAPRYSTDWRIVQKIVTIKNNENAFERIIFTPNSDESTNPNDSGKLNVLKAK